VDWLVYYTYVFVGVCGSRGTLCVKATKIVIRLGRPTLCLDVNRFRKQYLPLWVKVICSRRCFLSS
jgi:hypothetical protein